MKTKWSVALWVLPALAVLLPAMAFCAILTLGTVNLPLRDDYDTILNFSNELADRTTFAARFALLLGEQSNEYKLYVLHGVVWLQAGLTHHINFRVLIGMGDAFVLLLGILLWRQFLPTCTGTRHKWIYFVPVSCLLFQLRYQEAADWSTAALQHMPCLFFSIAAIYLVCAPSTRRFCAALACLAFAVFSSGNGFLAMPVGLLSLVLARRYGRALWWTAFFAALAAMYFHHYVRVNLQAKQSFAASIFEIHPTYFLLFLGSIAARPSLLGGILLGFAMCAFLTYFAVTGSLRRVTSTAYCMSYLLLTALAVAVFRGDVDPVQISTSRYTIYSALALIFSWMLLLERRGERGGGKWLPGYLLKGVVVASALFAASTYVTGFRAIQRTNRTLVVGMATFENPKDGGERMGPVLPVGAEDDEQKSFEVRARQELTRSIQLGLYRPPPL